ncbi:hypothetical protein QYF61_015135 [Mycteria americana]|uniref:Uncharacterized protein n=1 Tax=Mycteria americana TaxID=33587 RepID=A0AAN7NGA9_MYCAM|nr:hypothetical protein QYF61_015135 [Mycteria americana]
MMKGVENKTEHIVMPLYKYIVQPCLEYCVQLRCLYLQRRKKSEHAKPQSKERKVTKGVGHGAAPVPAPPELEDRDREQNKPPIIEEEAVNDLLHHLDTHKSMGLDGIHPRVLRELAEELAKPLSIIYQQSWLTREVPDNRRLANVTPIYKKGRKEDQGN